MRYDRDVYFCSEGEKVYDATTGDYIKNEPSKQKITASVVGTSLETMHIVYGAIKRGSLTVHIQNHYTEPFDYIEIDGCKYKVDHVSRYRTKESYIVSGVS